MNLTEISVSRTIPASPENVFDVWTLRVLGDHGSAPNAPS